MAINQSANPYDPPAMSSALPVPPVPPIVYSSHLIWIAPVCAFGASSIVAAAFAAKVALKRDWLHVASIILFVVLVGLFQIVAVFQVRFEKAFHELVFSQVVNWISWALVMGVLIIAHELHSHVPTMNTADAFTFGCIAFVSGVLCLITSYLRRKVRAWKQV